ncbi:MAG: type II secretion system protein F, partial [Pseudonocardiales bacterium]
MGTLIGLVLGVGLLLIVRSTGGSPVTDPAAGRAAGGWRQRRTDLLRQAGIEGVSHAQLVILQVISAGAATVLVLVVSGAVTVALAFAVIAFRAPPAVVRRLRDRRVTELREVWPEVVDNLASAVR